MHHINGVPYNDTSSWCNAYDYPDNCIVLMVNCSNSYDNDLHY